MLYERKVGSQHPKKGGPGMFPEHHKELPALAPHQTPLQLLLQSHCFTLPAVLGNKYSGEEDIEKNRGLRSASLFKGRRN